MLCSNTCVQNQSWWPWAIATLGMVGELGAFLIISRVYKLWRPRCTSPYKTSPLYSYKALYLQMTNPLTSMNNVAMVRRW